VEGRDDEQVTAALNARGPVDGGRPRWSNEEPKGNALPRPRRLACLSKESQPMTAARDSNGDPSGNRLTSS
jgi:hypothetical protein